MKGRTVTIPLSVPVVPHCPGETLHAKLTVTSNGNQRFEVPVSLAVVGRGAAAVNHSGTGHGGSRQYAGTDLGAGVVARNAQGKVRSRAGTRGSRTDTGNAAQGNGPRGNAGSQTAKPRRRQILLAAAVADLFLLLGLMVTGVHDLITWAMPQTVVAPPRRAAGTAARSRTAPLTVEFRG